MPDWILLLPLLFPLVAALTLVPVAARLPLPLRQAIAIAFVVVEILLILLNIAPGTHRLEILTWEPGFTLVLQMDGITQLLLLTMFVPLVALWLIAPTSTPFDLHSTLVLVAAIVLAMANGLVATYVGWTLLDLALLAWRIHRNIEPHTAIRSLVIGLLTGLILFAGAILLAGARPLEGATLLALALWARLGLYPFHPLLPLHGAGVNEMWLARGVPLLAAANLWLHWSAFGADAPYLLINLLAGAALVIAAVWVWREEDPLRALAAGTQSALIFIPLAVTYGGDAWLALALWLTLASAFALALFEAALRWRAENLNRFARVLGLVGVITLAGLPLTPAFLARLGTYIALWESAQWGFVIGMGFATLVIFPPLWNLALMLNGSEKREPHPGEYIGLTILLLMFLAFALTPTLIAAALAPTVGEAAGRALLRVLAPNDVLALGIGITMLIVPFVASFFLRGLAARRRPNRRGLLARIARIGDLDWLEHVVSAVGFQMGMLARNVFTITEENPTVWILLISLWVAIFIAIAR